MGNYENLIKKEIRYTYTDDKTGEFISVSSVPESDKIAFQLLSFLLSMIL